MVLWCVSAVWVREMPVEVSPEFILSLLLRGVEIDGIGEVSSRSFHDVENILFGLLSRAEALGRHPVKGVLGAVGYSLVRVFYTLSLLSSDPVVHAWQFKLL